MRRFLIRSLAIGVLAAGLLAPAARGRADCPQYVTLQMLPYGYGRPAPVQTYSYGWFGVEPRHTHAVFHWSFYDHLWIWW